MKVDDLAYNNRYSASAQQQHARKVRTAPSFKGRALVETPALEDAVANLMPKSLKMLKKLGSNGGEIQNIVINSLGTGLVAPIFIKYNFMSKTDEDTRTYSAWRQPVSAVLAVVTQCGLTAPFYKIFDNWANKGVFGEKLNKTLFMDDYYITKMKKKENPNMTKAQLQAEVKTYKEEQAKALEKMLSDKSTVLYRTSNGKTQKISDVEYRNLLTETIDKQIARDKAIKKELETTVSKRMATSNYYRTHNKEAHDIFDSLYSVLKDANGVSDVDKFIAAKIKEVKSKPDSKEMLTILKDIQNRAHKSGGNKEESFKNVRKALIANVKKMIGHVEKYQNVTSEAQVQQLVLNSVKQSTTEVNESITFFENLKRNISEKTLIPEIQKAINEKRAAIKVSESSLSKDFAKETAKQLISRTSAHMKCYKQIIGVFVSLAVLPLTCTLLNEIYPRFMDIFFPNLSSKKHEHESSKLIAQAPKKVEVA